MPLLCDLFARISRVRKPTNMAPCRHEGHICRVSDEQRELSRQSLESLLVKERAQKALRVCL